MIIKPTNEILLLGWESVAENLKKQQEVEKNDPILGRDYTKPDLRMFPLLKSISNSLKSLSTS